MFASKSIKKILQRSNWLILLVALVPLLFNSIFYTQHIFIYQRSIQNINQAKDVSTVVKDELLINIWDLVTGQTGIDSLTSKSQLEKVRSKITTIKGNTTTPQEIRLLDVANRTLNTIQGYLDEIIIGIQTEQPVAQNEEIMVQVESVNQLLYDVLQEFVQLEIDLAGKKSDEIIQSVTLLTSLQALLFIGILLFVRKNRRTMNEEIKEPINDLVTMAEKLAQGDLSYRITPSEVAELTILARSLNQMAQELDRLLIDNAEKQYHLAQSEVKVLQAQITPHFVYNSLDAILTLVEQEDLPQVKVMTYALSDFFRISLSRGQDWIPLEKEIRHIEDYLTILKIRYGETLRFTINAPTELKDYYVLKMILQPLVENAVYHGTRVVRRQGIVTITVKETAQSLIFTIKDNGLGMTPERLTEVKNALAKGIHTSVEDGYGLYNVNKRILLYYGEKAQLTITSVYQEGTLLTLILPKIAENKKNLTDKGSLPHV